LDKRLPGATAGRSLLGQVPPVGLPGKIVPQANVNLGMTMSKGARDLLESRPWWDVPAADIEEPWPRPGLKDGGDWADLVNTFHPPVSAIGLRRGLLAALDRAITELGEYTVDSEQQLLWRAMYLLTDMLKAGDEQLTWLIAEARHKGMSWTDIGAALGISKQAAHKRFARQVESALASAPYQELSNWSP
jgi:hypothetical protein